MLNVTMLCIIYSHYHSKMGTILNSKLYLVYKDFTQRVAESYYVDYFIQTVSLIPHQVDVVSI